MNRLIDPRGMDRAGVVAAAAVVGFFGNEWVARHRIRSGRRIGSARRRRADSPRVLAHHLTA
ncbi:hypothetical protein SAMN04489712_112136 [Thermomonospora echinospora]|uniref:Uncharacterized protein n=1 Tax=Thermomonospora echinospora TaxID=1992 RepID=A0A1H6D276_9ACTN|nr:hypothetical protein [Thermomonospora echinospora]SEG78875.1 hypothetical protein SAMN04489712_112136 [Thermomonospora echinospora]